MSSLKLATAGKRVLYAEQQKSGLVNRMVPAELKCFDVSDWSTLRIKWQGQSDKLLGICWWEREEDVATSNTIVNIGSSIGFTPIQAGTGFAVGMTDVIYFRGNAQNNGSGANQHTVRIPVRAPFLAVLLPANAGAGAMSDGMTLTLTNEVTERQTWEYSSQPDGDSAPPPGVGGGMAMLVLENLAVAANPTTYEVNNVYAGQAHFWGISNLTGITMQLVANDHSGSGEFFPGYVIEQVMDPTLPANTSVHVDVNLPSTHIVGLKVSGGTPTISACLMPRILGAMLDNVVDVAGRYQPPGTVPWSQYNGGIIQVSHGLSEEDHWRELFNEVVAAGLPLGLYHFAEHNPPEQEAAFFRNLVGGGWVTPYFGWFVDVEWGQDDAWLDRFRAAANLPYCFPYSNLEGYNVALRGKYHRFVGNWLALPAGTVVPSGWTIPDHILRQTGQNAMGIDTNVLLPAQPVPKAWAA